MDLQVAENQPRHLSKTEAYKKEQEMNMERARAEMIIDEIIDLDKKKKFKQYKIKPKCT